MLISFKPSLLYLTRRLMLLMSCPRGGGTWDPTLLLFSEQFPMQATELSIKACLEEGLLGGRAHWEPLPPIVLLKELPFVISKGYLVTNSSVNTPPSASDPFVLRLTHPFRSLTQRTVQLYLFHSYEVPLLQLQKF